MTKIFNPDTNFTDDFYEKGRYQLMWRLSLFFTGMFAALSCTFFFIDTIAFSIYFTVFLLSVSAIIYLKVTKKNKLIYWITVISATILTTFSMNVIRDTLHYSELLWIICIVLFAYIGLSKKIAIIFAAINLTSLLYFILFKLNAQFLMLQQREITELIAISIEILFTFSIIVFLLHQNIRFQNYSREQLEISNQYLKEKNKENTVLLKEVHHRVKNNLQIVVSLLRIQSSEIKSKETQIHFETAINRIMTICVIHQKLYQLGELSQIEFSEYLNELVGEIKQLHCTDKAIKKTLQIDLKKIDLRCIVPIGLIINELITNSIKHAFSSKDENPKINITLTHADEPKIAVLTYSDNGTWKENATSGFGTELIQTLTNQIDGELTRDKSTISIRFHYSSDN